MLRLSVSFLASVAISGVLLGCGSSGSSGVSPGAYVKSVCTAVGPFEKDVSTRSSALNLATFTNAAQGKKALHGFLSAVAADSDSALAKLNGAGSPNVKNGKAIAGAITNAFAQLKGVMDKAVRQASSLPTTSPVAFRNAAQALGSSVRSSMSGIGTSLQTSTLKSGELETAAAKEPACKAIAG